LQILQIASLIAAINTRETLKNSRFVTDFAEEMIYNRQKRVIEVYKDLNLSISLINYPQKGELRP
jgi:hypothetical protein